MSDVHRVQTATKVVGINLFQRRSVFCAEACQKTVDLRYKSKSENMKERTCGMKEPYSSDFLGFREFQSKADSYSTRPFVEDTEPQEEGVLRGIQLRSAVSVIVRNSI